MRHVEHIPSAHRPPANPLIYTSVAKQTVNPSLSPKQMNAVDHQCMGLRHGAPTRLPNPRSTTPHYTPHAAPVATVLGAQGPADLEHSTTTGQSAMSASRLYPVFALDGPYQPFLPRFYPRLHLSTVFTPFLPRSRGRVNYRVKTG